MINDREQATTRYQGDVFKAEGKEEQERRERYLCTCIVWANFGANATHTNTTRALLAQGGAIQEKMNVGELLRTSKSIGGRQNNPTRKHTEKQTKMTTKNKTMTTTTPTNSRTQRITEQSFPGTNSHHENRTHA